LESRGSEGVDEGSSVRREKRQVKKDTFFFFFFYLEEIVLIISHYCTNAVFSWVASAASRRCANFVLLEYNVFRGLIHIPLGLSLGSSPTDYAWPQRRV